MSRPTAPVLRLALVTVSLFGLSACSDFDLDFRGKLNPNNFSTADAALAASSRRPNPDDRGIISYPNYQVAVARRGDTLRSLAARIDLPVNELAEYNGIKPDDPLRTGEIIALPRRVAEPSPATGAESTGPILPPEVNVTELASAAIDTSEPTPPAASKASNTASPKAQTGIEPIRHKVVRGETAYTIARLYNISVKTLGEWNSLDRDFKIREGQYLLIPVGDGATAPLSAQTTTAPGQGSPTPQPPSAATPLPTETPPAAAETRKATPAVVQDLGKEQTSASKSDAAMVMPVDGRIIRDFTKGGTDGIDIAGTAGAPVRAAASGVVAAITTDADNMPIVVIKHPDNLLTVYINPGDVSVNKGDRVSRGQQIAKLRPGSPPYLHFEVRRGFDSVDPMDFLP